MKRPILHLLISIAVLIFIGPLLSYASWNLVGQFQNPVDCGFFFDAYHGLLGTGIRSTGASTNPYSAQIYKTTNGGATWIQSKTPKEDQAAVTNIHMQTSLIGYASIFADDLRSILWKTVDGGDTWIDISTTFGSQATCVYSTPRAVVLTEWRSSGRDVGGTSTDGGATFTQVFFGATNGSNGIDFTDDLHGVVTVGPENGFPPNPVNYYTTDGGVSWNESNYLPESWGVYGVKGTMTFFCAGEGSGNQGQSKVYESTDGGVTWASVYTFPGNVTKGGLFTGHIAGMAQRLYCQVTNRFTGGVYRSDNLGGSWTNVGGPSNERDTRFVVTGCTGEVVYAFDDNGNVYKTLDGGDGTLHYSGSGSPLSILVDTLRLFTDHCSPVSQTIPFTNQSCLATLIDSSLLIGDSLSALSGANIFGISVAPNSNDSIVIRYSPAHDGRDTMILTLHAHQGSTTINHTIVLATYNNTAPQPEIGTLVSKRAGDTLQIPIFLQPTKDNFSIRSYNIHLRYNGDVLTSKDFTKENTLSKDATTIQVQPDGLKGVTVSATLPNPITQDSDLTIPLLLLKAYVTLSDSVRTMVSLDSFAIGGSSPLALCSFPEQLFEMQLDCGDSLISKAMGGSLTPPLLSIVPNPSEQNSVTVTYRLSAKSPVVLEVLNEQGSQIAVPIQDESEDIGLHTRSISTADWPSGTYFVCLRTAGTGGAMIKMLQLR